MILLGQPDSLAMMLTSQKAVCGFAVNVHEDTYTFNLGK